MRRPAAAGADEAVSTSISFCFSSVESSARFLHLPVLLKGRPAFERAAREASLAPESPMM